MSAVSGSPTYPILLLTSLAILLAAGLARRGVGASTAADRWTTSSAALLGLLGMWLAASSLEGPAALLPSLERLTAAALASLVAWSAVGEAGGLGLDRRVVASLAAAAVLFSAGVLSPPAGPFNVSSLDFLWGILTLIVGASAMAAVADRRPQAWPAFASALAALLAGQAAHIVAPPAGGGGAPWLSLGLAVAAPLTTLAAVVALVREPLSEPRRWPEPTTSLPPLQAFLQLSSAREAASFAASLTEAVGGAIGAEVCLLLTPPEADGSIAIGAGFDRVRGARLPATRLEPNSCPVFSQGMTLGRSVHLPSGTHAPDAATVLRAIGLAGRAPALLVPLVAGGRTVAGLVLLSPQAQRDWHEGTRRAVEAIAPALGETLDDLMQAAPDRAEVVTSAQALEEARLRIAELEALLAAGPEPGSELIGLEELRQQLDESHQVIEVLEAEIRRMSQAAPSEAMLADVDASRLQGELGLALQALAEARAAATERPQPSRGGLPSHRLMASLLEARQPLTAIGGYTDLLLGESIGLLGATQRKFLERIRSAVRRLDGELAGLATTVSAARTPSEKVATDLGPLIEAAIEAIHDDLRDKSFAVRLDLPPGPIPVLGEARTLRSILGDLLETATAGSPEGRELLISVLRDTGEGVVVLTVSDHGRSSPAGSAPTGRPPRGRREEILEPEDLGLARVKSLTESLGGRLWVDRDTEGGSLYSVLLPAGPEG